MRMQPIKRRPSNGRPASRQAGPSQGAQRARVSASLAPRPGASPDCMSALPRPPGLSAQTGFPAEVEAFINGLDAAMDAHMSWTRRVLRCAVLRTSPGDDVLRANAHARCAFGSWLAAQRPAFDAVDAAAATRIGRAHKFMHDAIRAICRRAIEGAPAQERDLEAFEQTQSELLHLLAGVKNLVLTTSARLDPLTGLPMRYGVEHEFERCRQDALRRHEHLFVAMLDIDHFKRVNDEHGHLAGDAALRGFAVVLKAHVRRNEPLYRFGGEEFLVVLRTERAEQIDSALARLLDAIRDNPIILDSGLRLRLTATLGASMVEDGDDFAAVLTRADAALYKGKRSGRDRYVLAQVHAARGPVPTAF